MAWVHTLEETESVSEALMPTLIEKVFGGPFAAPVFMVALGIGLVYTKHATASHFAKRGIELLIIGFAQCGAFCAACGVESGGLITRF